jgi:hypothetical protein
MGWQLSPGAVAPDNTIATAPPGKMVIQVTRPLPAGLVAYEDPRLQRDWQSLLLTNVNMPGAGPTATS